MMVEPMEMAGLIPISTASSENTPDDDTRIEALLTEQLMQGHVLLEAGCPSCNTPLIKARSPLLQESLSQSQLQLQLQLQLQQIASTEGNNSINDSKDYSNLMTNTSINSTVKTNTIRPFIIPSHSFETPFTPLPGIPFCVSCHAHVVMTEDNVKVLEGCDTLKDKGQIFVALLEPSLTMDTQEEAAAAVERIAARIQALSNPPLPTIVTATTHTSQTVTTVPSTTSAATPTASGPIPATTGITTTATTTNHPLELFCGSTLSRQVPVSSPKEALEAADRVLTQCGVGNSSAMFDIDDGEDEEHVEEVEEEGFEAGLEDHGLIMNMNDITPTEDMPSEVEDQLMDHVILPPPDADLTDDDDDDALIDAALTDAVVPTDEDVPTPEDAPTDKYSPTEDDAPTDEDTPTGVTTTNIHDTNTLDNLNEDQKKISPSPPPPPPPRQLEVSTELYDDAPREVERKEDEDEDGLGDYSVRREIATKVLGAKMLQGYTLQETCCNKCGMPLMEYAGELDCVVCPVLAKKARKKLKAERRVISPNEEGRVEEMMRQAQEERRQELQREEEERMQAEEQALEDAQREEEERLLAEAQKLEDQRIAVELEEQAKLAEEERIAEEERLAALAIEEERQVDQMVRNQLARLEEARALQEQLVEEAKVSAELALQDEMDRLKEQEAIAMEKARTEYVEHLRMEAILQEERRRQNEEFILLETRRLEEKELSIMSGSRSVSSTEMRELQTRETDRQRMEKNVAAVKAAELARLEAELETRREAEEKRASEEASLIESLEADAKRKSKAAEDAIARAKAALQEVSSAKKHSIATTIAQAEAEAIAEAESIVMAEAEGFCQPHDVPQSATSLERQRWEILRSESRSVVTRRMMQGWTMTATMCQGVQCQGTPLIQKFSITECVVCGGTGSGKDGVYTDIDDDDEFSEDDEDCTVVPPPSLVREFAGRNSVSPPMYSARATDASNTGLPKRESWSLAPRAVSPTAILSVEKIKEDFDVKRNLVSKEIGKKMMQGWILLDGSCPNCVMPLMTDGVGGPDTCVLCGPLTEASPPEDNFDTDNGEPIVVLVDAPAHMDHTDFLESRATTPRGDPPALSVDDKDTYSAATLGEKCRSKDESTTPTEESEDEDDDNIVKDDDAVTKQQPVNEKHLVKDGDAFMDDNSVTKQERVKEQERFKEGHAVMDDNSVTKQERVKEQERFKEGHAVVDDTSVTKQERVKEQKHFKEGYAVMDDTSVTKQERVKEQKRFKEGYAVMDDEADKEQHPVNEYQRVKEQESAKEEIHTETYKMDETTISLPSNFDPTDEASVRRLLIQLQSTKSPMQTSNGSMERALAHGTAVITARGLHSDEVSHMTHGTTSFVKPPKPEFSPKAKSRTIQDDEIAALEQELNIIRAPPIPVFFPAEVPAGKRAPPSLPPRPVGIHFRSGSFDQCQAGAPPSPGTPGKPPRRRPKCSPSPRSSRSPNRRTAPRPEDDSPPRSRPVSRTSSANSLRSLRIPPMSPKVTRSSTPGFIGGARDDVSVMSDGGHSRVESVCSDALSTILDKLEDCKSTLSRSTDIMEQVEMANLISKLASAAIGLQKMDEVNFGV